MLLEYLYSQLVTINSNLQDITNPGYTYLGLAILIKMYRLYRKRKN